jgi:hypothetical protein
MSVPEIDDLTSFEAIAYDVAVNFGNTSTQSQQKMQRHVNRAAQRIATWKKRRWSWLWVNDYFLTISGTEEYSLPLDVQDVMEFWIQDSNRQKLDRIPTGKFRELVPDATSDSGTPRLYDWRGVDSNGAKVVSLWPIPSADDLKIYYRYKRYITPIVNIQDNVRAKWGMPPDVIEGLVEWATALAFVGINDARQKEHMQIAETIIDQAYADDQENQDTTYRMTPFEGDSMDDGPVFESRFGV